jgi:uncharacterized protein (TIGR02145 family)
MRSFILVGFLLIIHNQFSYSQCIEGDCNNGFGRYNYPNGDKYDGEFKDGKCQGQGKITWTDGSFYDGSFILNKTWGYGKYVWANGNVYEGNHLNNLKHGYGKLKYFSGELREGNWVAGQFTGKGKKTSSTGEITEGYFVNGELFNSYSPNLENSSLCISGNCINGNGTYKWPDGSKYIGEFKNGSMWGKGEKIWTNGIKYNGEWINNERTGQGIYYFTNGDIYEGEFVKGKITGFGVLTRANGDKNTGYFVDWVIIMPSDKQIANNSQTQLTSTSNPKSETSNNNLVSTTINKVSSTNSIAKDADGKVYKTVVIGTQNWMAENLNTSKFRNGDPIPEAKTDEEWKKAKDNEQPAWCYYNNDSELGERCGKLYNWHAVIDPRGLAPNGWHISTKYDWTILCDYLGGESFAGYKLKSKENIQEQIYYLDRGGYYETKFITCENCRVASKEYKKICPECKGMGGKTIKTGKYIPKSKDRMERKVNFGWDGSNETGFSALSGGARYLKGFYDEHQAFFWTTTKDGSYSVWWISLWGQSVSIKSNYMGESGLSIRCVKD